MSKEENPVQKIIDKLQAAVDSGRVRAEFLELLDEEPFSLFEEWAESLQQVASDISNVRDLIETWEFEEDREARADARDSVLEAIEDFLGNWDACPLDLANLRAFDEDAVINAED